MNIPTKFLFGPVVSKKIEMQVYGQSMTMDAK